MCGNMAEITKSHFGDGFGSGFEKTRQGLRKPKLDLENMESRRNFGQFQQTITRICGGLNNLVDSEESST